MRQYARVFVTIAAALSVALVSGCGSGSESSGDSDPTGSGEFGLTTSTPPAKGKVENVKWNLPYGEPLPLDPIIDWNPSENQILANLCEGLLKVGPDLKIQPWLAESWTNPNPTTWIYKIREGVKFWDGSPLTPEDVVYSLNRQIDPANASVYLNPYADQIKSVKTEGADSIRVTAKRPNVLVHSLMASGMSTVVEQTFVEQAGDDYGTQAGGLMCTGPFKFKNWRPGKDITIVRNSDYWDKDLVPKAASVTFTFITNSSTMTDALLSGEIDGSFDVPASGISRLQDSNSGTLYKGQSTNIMVFAWSGTEKLSDPRLRKALSLVIDRESLANVVYEDFATPLKLQMLEPIDYSYESDYFKSQLDKLPSIGVDPEAAKNLVEEAGAPDSPVKLAVQADDDAAVQVANALGEGAREIGLPVKIVPLQPSAFINLYLDPEASKDYDLVLGSSTWSDIADPLAMIILSWKTSSVTNFNGYGPPYIERAFNKAVATVDETKRAEQAVAIAKRGNEDMPYIPVLQLWQIMYLNERITGPSPVFPYMIHYPWAATIGSPTK